MNINDSVGMNAIASNDKNAKKNFIVFFFLFENHSWSARTHISFKVLVTIESRTILYWQIKFNLWAFVWCGQQILFSKFTHTLCDGSKSTKNAVQRVRTWTPLMGTEWITFIQADMSNSSEKCYLCVCVLSSSIGFDSQFYQMQSSSICWYMQFCTANMCFERARANAFACL